MNSLKEIPVCNACPDRDGLEDYFRVEKDNTQYKIRMLKPDDVVGLMDLYKSLDEESLYTRYCTYGKDPVEAAREAVDLSSKPTSLDLVVEDLARGNIVAHAGLVWDDYYPQEAEYHCVVSPPLQGRQNGNDLHLGSRMFEETVKLAIANGITTIHSDVLTLNNRMNRILRNFNNLGQGVTVLTSADNQGEYASIDQTIKRKDDPANLLVPCYAANGLCMHITKCPQEHKEEALLFAL